MNIYGLSIDVREGLLVRPEVDASLCVDADLVYEVRIHIGKVLRELPWWSLWLRPRTIQRAGGCGSSEWSPCGELLSPKRQSGLRQPTARLQSCLRTHLEVISAAMTWRVALELGEQFITSPYLVELSLIHI